MADSAFAPSSASAIETRVEAPRHRALVRVTHWMTALCFCALLLSGIEILISHPRFYWGEAGNAAMPALFQIPIPASRAAVKTGYGYVLPDQNGWSRYLHFQTAWLLVITGLLYGVSGFVTRHFQNDLLPVKADRSFGAVAGAIAGHLRFKSSAMGDGGSYNVLQRLTYLLVIFVLFPLIIWTGLAMSPAIVSAAPFVVTVFGGQQSARTIHFFVTVALVLFTVVHILMVCVSGFGARMRAMITGRAAAEKESA